MSWTEFAFRVVVWLNAMYVFLVATSLAHQGILRGTRPVKWGVCVLLGFFSLTLYWLSFQGRW